MTREEYNARMREYVQTKYKDKRDAYVKKWIKEHQEHVKEYFAEYYQEHKAGDR